MAERSTYQSLTDDIVSDANVDGIFSAISPEQFKSWVLRAEEAISSRIKIPERASLCLVAEKSDYIFNSTPQSITAASLTYPYPVTCASHGRSTGETITISGVVGMTELNGTWSITVIDDNSFSVDTLVPTNAYTSGGTFTSSSDIPVAIGDVYAVKKISSGYIMDIAIVDVQSLINAQHEDSVRMMTYGDIDSPQMCAIDYVDGVKTMSFHPVPTSDNSSVTIYGNRKVTPSDHSSDSVTASITLPTEYDSAIRHWVAAKAFEWGKMADQASYHSQAYEYEVQRLESSKPTHQRLRVVYQ